MLSLQLAFGSFRMPGRVQLSVAGYCFGESLEPTENHIVRRFCLVRSFIPHLLKGIVHGKATRQSKLG